MRRSGLQRSKMGATSGGGRWSGDPSTIGPRVCALQFRAQGKFPAIKQTGGQPHLRPRPKYSSTVNGLSVLYKKPTPVKLKRLSRDHQSHSESQPVLLEQPNYKDPFPEGWATKPKR